MFEERAYQNQIEENLRLLIRKGKRNIIVQSETGSGKSYMMAINIRKCVDKGNEAIWFVHRIDLVKQFSETLKKLGVPHSIIMRGHETDFSQPVQVVSRDTAKSLIKKGKWVAKKYAMAFFDECHLYPGESYSQHIRAQLGKTVVIGYTATPIRGSGKGLGRYFQAMVVGPKPSYLIKNGFIVPMTVFSHNLVKGLKLKLTDDNQVTKACAIQAEAKLVDPVMVGDVVSHWERYGMGHRTIVYAQGIKHSLALEKQFNFNGHKFIHVDGSTAKSKRREIYDQLKNFEIDGIVNVGIANIGLDIPEVSCIQNASVIRSLIDWRQKAGRAKRSCEGKKFAVMIDHCGAMKYLGHPDMDIEWSLDPNRDVYETIKDVGKQKPNDDEPKEFACKECGYQFHGMSVCPKCGKEIQKVGKNVETESGVLCHIDPYDPDDVDPEEIRKRNWERNKNIWLRCLFRAAGSDPNAKMNKACGIYKSLTGEFPQNDFPHVVYGSQWQQRIVDLFPQFKKKGG